MKDSLLNRTIITIEELEELGQALTKYLRYMFYDNTLRKDRIEIQEMIIEELADVELCLDKLKKQMCISNEDLKTVKEYKESRLKQLNK